MSTLIENHTGIVRDNYNSIAVLTFFLSWIFFYVLQSCKNRKQRIPLSHSFTGITSMPQQYVSDICSC